MAASLTARKLETRDLRVRDEFAQPLAFLLRVYGYLTRNVASSLTLADGRRPWWLVPGGVGAFSRARPPFLIGRAGVLRTGSSRHINKGGRHHARDRHPAHVQATERTEHGDGHRLRGPRVPSMVDRVKGASPDLGAVEPEVCGSSGLMRGSPSAGGEGRGEEGGWGRRQRRPRRVLSYVRFHQRSVRFFTTKTIHPSRGLRRVRAGRATPPRRGAQRPLPYPDTAREASRVVASPAHHTSHSLRPVPRSRVRLS